MKDVLRNIGLRFRTPLERAQVKARKERKKVNSNPITALIYWSHYRSLAQEFPDEGITIETLNARGAKPRHRLTITDVKNAAGGEELILTADTGINVPFVAGRLQEVVEFSNSVRRNMRE